MTFTQTLLQQTSQPQTDPAGPDFCPDTCPPLLRLGRVALAPACLQINEEAELHNRLLDDLDEQVDGTRSRLAAAQRRLKLVMRRSGSCKSMLLLFLVALVLVVVLVVGFKIAIHI